MQLSEEQIEQLRRSGLRLDREGRFWHEGEQVKHERMLEAFHRWIDRLDDGRYVLRLDEKRYVYIDVEDTPFIARTLRWDAGRALVTLQNGREEPLDARPLRLDEHGVVASVHGGRFPVRLSTRAWQALTAQAHEHDGRLSVSISGVDLALG